jgi:hypothetical protein
MHGHHKAGENVQIEIVGFNVCILKVLLAIVLQVKCSASYGRKLWQK